MRIERLLWPIAAGGCLCSLCGCANLNSIYRPLALGSTTEGAAVSLDVKQRALLSAPRAIAQASANGVHEKQVVFCSEPSPDALAALSTSGGLGVTTPSGPQVQTALASAESAAAIGLRTQSIQLLRDGLYANCLAYLNGLGADQYYELQRRSQIFTLGLLAIEQLTGVVKAQQATLGGGAAAATGSENTDKEVTALQDAQKATVEAQKSVDEAVLNQNTARQEIETQRAKVTVAQKTLTGLPKDASTADRSDAHTNLETEKATLRSKEQDGQQDDITVKEKRSSLANAQRAERDTNSALLAAKGRVSAAVSSAASMGDAGRSAPEITNFVATAVTQIVKAVLDESGRGEECNAFISQAGLVDPSKADTWAKQLSLVCSKEQVTTASAAANAAAPESREAVLLKNAASLVGGPKPIRPPEPAPSPAPAPAPPPGGN